MPRNRSLRNARGAVPREDADDPRPARRRRQLIEAAIDCIARLGLRDTKVADVAAEAGMAVGSISQYFRSKEALFAAVLEHLSAEFQAAWQAEIARGTDHADRLLAFVATYFRPETCSRRKVAVWFAFWGEVRAQPAYRRVCQRYDRHHDETLAELCQALIADAPHADLEPRAAAKIIAALCQGLWLEFLTGADGLDRRDLEALARRQLAALFPLHRRVFAAGLGA